MVEFREAILSDTRQVVSLLKEIMEHHGVVPPSVERLTATVSGILGSPNHVLLVADQEGGLVGMCALVFSQSTWSAGPVCELQDVLVTSAHRRREIGTGLVRAAELVAKARSCSRLFLLAEVWNLDAHDFYRSFGFAEKTCFYFEKDLSLPTLTST